MISGANAADVYTRGPSIKDSGPVDYAPAITWTGFYLGAHAGATAGDNISLNFNDPTIRDLEGDVDSVGIFGIHVGYNWQNARNLVLGLEGSLTLPFDSDDFGAETLGSVRGRLGYAMDKTLIYATGGVAFLDSEDADETQVGWVAGLGVEHKIRDNVSIGLEGLYYAFEDDFAGAIIDGERINSPLEAERDFWTIQARVTYHFNDRTGDPLK
jgi:outer membrane immunogenic protein